MMPGFTERMDRWLAVNRPDYDARLRPGATDAALDAFEARIAPRLPGSFRASYRWRDGQDPDCTASLHDNRMFSSLGEVAETKEMLDGIIGSDFEDPRGWRRGWVPFLADGGGDDLRPDAAAEDGGEPGPPVAFWHDWEDRPAKFPGFEAWLRQSADSMEVGTLDSA